MQNTKTTLAAILALLILALIWSYNWIVMKSVLAYMGPLDFAALRCVLGAAFLLMMLPLFGRSIKPPPWRPMLWIGILQTGGMTGLSQLALVAGGAGKTAVLVYTMPFWMIPLAALFLNERPRRMQCLAMAVAVIGLLLVIQPWQLQGALFSSLLASASGVAWAAGSVVTKRLYRHQAVDLLSLTTWQMVVGAVLLSALAITTHEQPIVWSSYTITALAYNALLATALGWGLWLFILRTLSTSVAGISMLLVPVMSVLWAWWLLSETPNGAEAAGMFLILLALALISVRFRGPQLPAHKH